MVKGEIGGLLPPPDRQLMTKSQYAEHRQVSPSAVTRAIREKRVVLVRAGAREFIDVKASDAVWSATTKRRVDSPGPATPAPNAPIPMDELRAVRLRRERAEAESRELDLDIRAGLLVERAEVEYLLADLGAAFKSRLDNLPDIVAPSLAAHAGDMEGMRRALREHANSILHELADHFTRQVARRLPPVTEPKEVAEDG